MTLINRNFIGFDGEPITGRVPARVDVRGPALTPQQAGEVAHRYKLFCDAAATAIGGYLAQDKVLSDGSRVRMTRNLGVDAVTVWTARKPGGPIDFPGYIIFPTDYDHPFGWDKDIRGNTIGVDAYIAIDKRTQELLPTPPITLHTKLNAGSVNWIGASATEDEPPINLSYDHGGSNRYWTNAWDYVTGAKLGLESLTHGEQNVYYRGVTITTPFKVHAAGVLGSWLICISGNTAYAAQSPLRRIDGDMARGIFPAKVEPTFNAVPGGTVPAGTLRTSAWHFSPDGTKAACITTVTSAQLTAWNFYNSMVAALPQSVQRMHFEINTLTGALSATLSSTPLAVAPLAVLIDGVHPDTMYNTWTDMLGTKALTYTGKRILGVDFAADGTELILSLQQSGSGTSTFTSPPQPEPQVTTFTATQSWGLYINDEALVTAPTIVPTLTSSSVFEGTTYTVAGTVTANYLSLYDIDMRFGMAVVERLTRTSSAVGSGSATLAIEHYFDGVLAETFPITPPSGMSVAANLAGNPSWRTPVVGLGWSYSGPDYTSSYATAVPFWPTAQGYSSARGENLYSYYYEIDDLTTQGSSGLPTDAPWLQNYPNQVADAMFSSSWYYPAGGLAGTIYLYLQFGPTTTGPAVGPTGVSSPPDYLFNDGNADILNFFFFPTIENNYTTDRIQDGGDLVSGGSSFWPSKRAVRGFAKKNLATRHYLLATKNTASRVFFNTIRALQQLQAGSANPPPQTPPRLTLSAFIRPEPTALDPDPAYTRYDLLDDVAAAITAEQGTVDTETLRVDAVRAI